MHLPHGLRWPFLGQMENFKILWTFWVIMKKSQGEAITKLKKGCNSIMLTRGVIFWTRICLENLHTNGRISNKTKRVERSNYEAPYPTGQTTGPIAINFLLVNAVIN